MYFWKYYTQNRESKKCILQLNCLKLAPHRHLYALTKRVVVDAIFIINTLMQYLHRHQYACTVNGPALSELVLLCCFLCAIRYCHYWCCCCLLLVGMVGIDILQYPAPGAGAATRLGRPTNVGTSLGVDQ